MRRDFSFLFVPVLLCVSIVLVFVFDNIFSADFAAWGILPRSFHGLRGILFAPFIHGDIEHLISNMSAFPVLICMLCMVYRSNYVRIISSLWLSTGFLVWIFARSSYHIGVSGIIYALASFLFFGGIISRKVGAVSVSLIMIFLYGGMIWGIFPGLPHVSWESHAFGALSGFFWAFFFNDGILPGGKSDRDWDFRFPGFSRPSSTDNFSGINYDWKP